MIKAKLNAEGRLSDKKILDLISKHDTTKYKENELYFKGENPILRKYTTKDDTNYNAYVAAPTAREDIAPNNKIPVPYARKISLTTKNYMFAKPVSYTADDKEYIERLNDVFFVNQNNRKVNTIGQGLIVHGVSYKLFYQEVKGTQKVPYFAVIDPDQIIPVYSYDIEPVLITCIRHFVQKDDDDKDITKVELYYKDATIKGEIRDKKIYPEMLVKHEWGRVPVVVYGDDYQLGVFDSIKKLIDGIDIIVSCDLNEIQRFELLYMVLIGDKMPTDPIERMTILRDRIIELSNKDSSLSYLERHIDGDFNMQLLDRLEKLVHKMSGVPDFESPEFAAESGIALLYKLMGFENIASQVENIFKAGELESIDLINSMMEGATDKFLFWEQNKDKQVKIAMFRNLPEDVMARLNEANAMKTLGISTETILDHIPVIDNTAEELERIAGERMKSFTEFSELNGTGETSADGSMETPTDVEAESKARLKGTVGGVQGILEVQKSVSAGTADYDSAVNILMEIYGFSEVVAKKILGKPKKAAAVQPVKAAVQ